MCWCVCDYWQEGSLTLQRRVTGFSEKHFTSPHRAVASGFSASPSSSKCSTYAFPGTTYPGFHSFWLLPFPKFRSSHSRWAVHCCPRLRGEDSSSDDSANSGSDSDVTLHFTILEGWASPAGIATLLFDPFSCFFFVDFFTSASFLFLNHLCFWPLVFSSSVLLFCRRLLLFDRLSSYVMKFFLLGLFFFMSFFPFFCCVSPCFPFLKSFLFFFTQRSVSFMLVLSLPFSFCFDRSTKYLVSFAQFFLFPFFYSAYFLSSFFLAKKNQEQNTMGDGLMQRMSRGRDQWQLIVHRLRSLNNVTARGSDQESFQSRNAIFDAYEKVVLLGIFFQILFEKKLSKWVKEKQCFLLFWKKKNVLKQDIPFQKKWTIKQENNKDNSKLCVFLVIEWLVCDTDSPWVVRQWMLSIICICSLSPFLLSLRIPSFLNTWRQVTRKIGQLQAVKPRGWNVHQDFRRHENSNENHVPQPQED